MAYNIEKDNYTCDCCGFEMKWDASDDIHGSMWSCEGCECTIFCSKCFIDQFGPDDYEQMLQGDQVLCPACWEKHKEEKKRECIASV